MCRTCKLEGTDATNTHVHLQNSAQKRSQRCFLTRKSNFWFQLKSAILPLMCFQNFCGGHKFPPKTKWFWSIICIHSDKMHQLLSRALQKFVCCTVRGQSWSLSCGNAPCSNKDLRPNVLGLHGVRSSSCAPLIWSCTDPANRLQNSFPFEELNVFLDLRNLLAHNHNKRLGHIWWQTGWGVRLWSYPLYLLLITQVAPLLLVELL